MSRIGRMPIAIPAGVEIKIGANNEVTVKGPKGTLSETLHPDMIIKVEGDQIIVARPSEAKEHRALHGLTRSLLNNMVVGVTNGFEKTLEINGVGYRCAKQGKTLSLTLGFSHPVEMVAPAGIKFECPTQTEIVVSGVDKELVGQTAANIKAKRPVEPYHAYGIRYKEEVVTLKVGKRTGK